MKTTTSTNRPRQAAFTLIEMVLVLAIMALLIGGAIGLMGGIKDRAKEVRVQADFKALDAGISAYESRSLRPPTSAQGLEALVNKPTVAPMPKGWKRIMDRVPVDPWGIPYGYAFPGKNNSTGYDLMSAGPDRTMGTEDDLGNWESE